MITTIPPIIFTQIVQIKSSPETIAVLLNETEHMCSSSPKHWRAKRRYPYWRPCPICGQSFSVENNGQYHKRKTCSRLCANRMLAAVPRDQTHKRKGRTVACPRCGKETYRTAAHLRKVKDSYCSRSCRAKYATGPLIRQHAANGKGKKRPGKGLAGALNPAWKGGVTYFKKHGNYKGVKYIRCPAEFISMARKDGYVMEHRIMVAQAIGRPLLRSEVVHHKDHDPAHNTLDNFQLFASNRDHKLYEHHGSPSPIWQL